MHHHPDAQRWRHLRGEDVQQLVVVERIPLSARPWSEDEHTEQLALAGQWDNELRARRLQGTHGGRIGRKLSHIHHASRLRQRRANGVVGGDGERLRGRLSAILAGLPPRLQLPRARLRPRLPSAHTGARLWRQQALHCLHAQTR